MTTYILNENKEVVSETDIPKWEAWMKEPENRRISFTALGKGVDILTVFTGFDPLFGAGAEQLFETVVFNHDGMSRFDTYATLEHAEAGHAAAIQEVQRQINKKTPPVE